MYNDFAEAYDVFMAGVPYESWCHLIDVWTRRFGITRSNGAETEANLLLELGCGTGTLTEMLAAAGYDCIGIDSSPQMLAAAAGKQSRSGSKVLYLCQKMQEMELYGTVGTVICMCNSLNYLLTEEEITATFSRVNNYLYPGGIFIFDFNTVLLYERQREEPVIVEHREDCSYIWENDYDGESGLNEYEITVFLKEEDDRYRRFQETHVQRGFTLSQMRQWLERAGLEFVAAFDCDTMESAAADSERIYMIAREAGK